MSGYTLLWLLWGLAFLAIEIPAVNNSRAGDTLSGHVWRFIGRGERVGAPLLGRQLLRLRRAAFLAFWAWLSVHLLTGWV